VQRRHLTDDQVEAFVRDKVAGPGLARMEEHLLFCDPCQRRVEKLSHLVADLRAAVSAIGLLGVVHATSDGPVRLRSRQLQGEQSWLAELSGHQRYFARTFASLEQASAFAQRMFHELCPEHVCVAGCDSCTCQGE